MAKLRHIALIVPDPDKAAKFFEDAFDMKIAGRARRGVYVSDGIINVALKTFNLFTAYCPLSGNFLAARFGSRPSCFGGRAC